MQANTANEHSQMLAQFQRMPAAIQEPQVQPRVVASVLQHASVLIRVSIAKLSLRTSTARREPSPRALDQR